ncbi:MAG TPA: rhodoquinone biosynthesis methyltransferase RquA [Xanthomonadales bacterium]|nr:rhodoquinone biosynthesis methyltransferase RquA [Xanthomonadales bacterium]
MNDDSGAFAPTNNRGADCEELRSSSPDPSAFQDSKIPEYLKDTYWWAYLHPNAVRFWEREWLVNAILWGNMQRLTSVVINELEMSAGSSVLQMACVYGQFSNNLTDHVASQDSQYHVLDIAPIQLANVRRKLSGCDNVSFHLQDSSKMHFPDASFEHAVMYFLLHEQPESVRRRSLAEALRVVKPGGKVVIVDYHRPYWWNGLRIAMWPVLKSLEPFALDLWRNPIESWLPADGWESATDLYCGGLYQKTVLKRL